MNVEFGNTGDIDEWMSLVEKIRYNFPGLETNEGIAEHREVLYP